MAKFTYNNTKNANISHIPFELNCGYYPYVFYKKILNLHSKSRIVEKLSFELQELMTIYQQNFNYAQKL